MKKVKSNCNTQLRNNYCQQFQVQSHVAYTHGSLCVYVVFLSYKGRSIACPNMCLTQHLAQQNVCGVIFSKEMC